MRKQSIAPKYNRRAKLADALAVTLLMLLMAAIGVLTYVAATPR